MGSREKMEQYAVAQDNAAVQSGQAYQNVLSLFDPESFVEIDSQVVSDVSDREGAEAVPGDGLISGYGTVDGRLVFVAAQDADVMAGGVGLLHAAKFSKTVGLALQAGAPFVAMLDSGGLRLDEGLLVLDGVADMVDSMREAKGVIPMLALVLGHCPGCLTFIPSLADLAIIAEDQGGIYLQSPGVTAAVEKTDASAQDIGGAAVSADQSGIAALSAPDTSAVIEQAVRLLVLLPDNLGGFAEYVDTADSDPNRSDLELDALAAGLDDGYDMDTVLAHVFDEASLLELYPAYAHELNGGLATLAGVPVVYCANRGQELGLDSSRKLSKILGLAERFNLPLITFTDVTGFVSGSEAEANGVSRVAAQVMAGFAELTIPRINVIVGEAIGTGYLVFNSKSTGADFVYAWPVATIGLQRADTAVATMARPELEAAQDPKAMREELIAAYEEQEMSAQNAASLGLVDEIIQPSATRPRLFSALQIIAGI